MAQLQSMMDDTGCKHPAFRVREATAEDNAALLALDRACVVAAATPVAFDRSPNFFARSRAYPSWRVYVAEGDAGLIGVGAMALKTVLVNGAPLRAAYFYDLRVAPGFRRLGVAKALGDAIRGHTRSLNPAVGYSLVMEGNIPSETFVQDRGSRPLRSCALSLIPVEAVPITGLERVRPLEEADAMSVLRLARAAHPDHDLFPFADVESLCDRLHRLDGLGFRGLYGWKSGGSLTGCVGLWDYSPVMRMRIVGSEDAWSWAAGRDLHLVFLMPLGFQGPAGVADAVRLAAERLRQESGAGAARVLAVPHDLADPGYAALDAFRPIRLGFTLFGLDLGGRQDLSLGSRMAFVDPADL
ncbi:MAG: GNAT family N-acetyltransferase [candidate division NC10 bacterium]|nr:GNAT family N-acetyltransferase [candidate division NC10 bacterium]